MKDIRVLVVGLGNMGSAMRAPTKLWVGLRLPGCVAGASRTGPTSKPNFLVCLLYADYAEALAASQPDAVSINTWPIPTLPMPRWR